MDSLCVHNVKSIKVDKIESSVTPFYWRNIIITSTDGKQFEISLFGKPKNLALEVKE
jgi:hypothetical protein